MAKEAKDVPVAPKAYVAFALYLLPLNLTATIASSFLPSSFYLHNYIEESTVFITCVIQVFIHVCNTSRQSCHVTIYVCAFKQARPNISFRQRMVLSLSHWHAMSAGSSHCTPLASPAIDMFGPW
jgi:hypothetical protein